MNFDRLAPHYDWLELVLAGGLLQKARTICLDQLADRRRVLSVGEGHGKFAAAFGQRWREADLTCVDASARMLSRAEGRARRSGISATWIHARVPGWQPPARAFDAIVTCFFLDCFPPAELRDVITTLSAAAAEAAAWLVVDFSIPERGPARWRAQAAHAAMYSFFRATTRLPARRWTRPDEYLRTEGFQLAHRDEFSWGLVRTDLWMR